VKELKAMYFVVLMAAAVVLLVIIVPVRASLMDDRIESSVRQSYVFKNYLNDDAIMITSKDGAVTLTGTVNLEYHKALATHTVANLPGVKSVDNRLELKSESPLENPDAWVSAEVTTALLFHRNANGGKTEVYVQEGIVTLRGETTSLAQKDLATEYVKDIVGVKDVKNEMAVLKTMRRPDKRTMGEKIDDASITALIKMTLLYHRSTSVINTRVATNDGVVTLSGKAKNAAERDLATKFVEDVRGVKSVKNHMTIL